MNIDGMKSKAWEIANIYMHSQINIREVVTQYGDRYEDSYDMDFIVEAINIYCDYLKQNVSIDTSKKKMNELIEKYEENETSETEALHGLMSFMKAFSDALNLVEGYPKQVRFTCPLCAGIAKGQSSYNSGRTNNYSCCTKCGFTVMT